MSKHDSMGGNKHLKIELTMKKLEMQQDLFEEERELEQKLKKNGAGKRRSTFSAS